MKKILLIGTAIVISSNSIAYEYLVTERESHELQLTAIHESNSINYTVENRNGTLKGSYTSNMNGVGLLYTPSNFSFALLLVNRNTEDEPEATQGAGFGIEYLNNKGTSSPVSISIIRGEILSNNGDGTTTLSATRGIHGDPYPREYGLTISAKDDKDGAAFDLVGRMKFPINANFNILLNGSIGGSTISQIEGSKLNTNVSVLTGIGLGVDILDNFQVSAGIEISRDVSSYGNNSKTNYIINSSSLSFDLTGQF